MNKKPNIVLITIDSLRADFVGYQNPKERNTPFLDSFAEGSYVFTNAISPANPTFFCFSSIMTGVLPFTYGKYLGIPDNPEIKTIAEVLKANNYSTYAYLANSPTLYSTYGYDKGFDYYDDGYENANKSYLALQEYLWKIRQKIPEAILNIFEIIRTFTKAVFFSPQLSIPGKLLNKKVIRHFSPAKQQPFFLWLHYMDTHLPFFSGLNEYFLPNTNPFGKVAKKIIFYKELITSIRRMRIRNNKITEIFKEAYRSCIRYIDSVVEEMINFLQNQYPNTIFIITSDHGEAFMEHGMFGHEAFSLYRELIDIPLLIYIPKGKAQRVNKTVSLVSIAKTICALTGVKDPQFQGDNLLENETFSTINNVSRILYKCRSPHVRLGILDNQTEIEGYRSLWSFTTPTEKYIEEEGGKTKEYYLLANDPSEKTNVIKKESTGQNLIIEKLQEIIRNTNQVKINN